MDRTGGVKEPSLISRIRCSYVLYMATVDWSCRYEGVWGFNTLTSKNARSNRPPQKPLALSSRIAEEPVSTSPPIGCRCGSIETLERRSAVRSLISLFLMDGYPPFRQERACAIENGSPQAH